MPLDIPKPTRFVQAGYKPVDGGFDKKEDEKQETSRERAARHRQERREELTYDETDEARWARNRERVSAERKLLNINEIFEFISKDAKVKEFINNPTGKCFNAAKRIGQRIRDKLGVDESDIKYRLILMTKPGMTRWDINVNNNENHMLCVLHNEGNKYILDPTIIQFYNIDSPFYGTEADWLKAIKPAWNGVVIKKAIQYIDYENYRSADNASVAYRMYFDGMKKDGGIFINVPQWYEEFNEKLTTKKKKSKFLSCFNSKVKD